MKDLIHQFIYEPWPWWIGGPLIGLFVISLILIEGKQLGISSSYQYVCAKISPWKLDYFKDPVKMAWQFWFVIGLMLGGFLLHLMIPPYQIEIAETSVKTLGSIGISEQVGFAPAELYEFTFKSIVILIAGGITIGFGARYANGCTAGHAIMGCAQLSPASIVSTICFFVGGLFATYFIVPYLF